MQKRTNSMSKQWHEHDVHFSLTAPGHKNHWQQPELTSHQQIWMYDKWAVLRITKTITAPDVNNLRMWGWADRALPRCAVPVPAGCVQRNPHWEAIICLCVSLLGPNPHPFPVTAGIWDTHLIVCCLILGSAGLNPSSLLSIPTCLCFKTAFTLFFFSTRWERAWGTEQHLRRSKMSEGHGVKSCS